MLEAATVVSALQMGLEALQTGKALVQAASDFYTATKENFSADSQAQIDALLASAATASDAAGVKAAADLALAAQGA